jgi:hypothetical protein
VRAFAAGVGKILWHLTLLASTVPLIVVAAMAVVRWHDGWHSLLFAALACLATFCIQMLGQVRDISGSIADFSSFVREFRQCGFSRVPLHEYVGALRRFYPEENTLSDEQLIVQVVPWSARRDPKRLRILVASDSPNLDDPSPPQAVAFATFFRAWVVLPMPPDRITEVQYFILIHEFGHVSPLSFGTRTVASGNLRRGLWAIPFLSAAIAPGYPLLTAIGVAGMCWYGLARWQQRQDTTAAREEDEIRADIHALSRCRRDWCQRFGPEQLAQLLCKEDATSQTPFHLRRESFVRNVRQLREGRPIEVPATLKERRLAVGLESLAAVAVSILCGLGLAALGWGRLAVIGGVDGFLAFLTFAVVVTVFSQAAAIEKALGVDNPLPPAPAM